ncbi:MAG TPA: acyl carrier protein [Terriglobales bacterium]|nr:acyl carrier protein [Terriglobales bacterium]
MTPNIFEQIRNIASDLFSIPVERITAETSPENVEAWDSTQHLNLVLALEEKYDFQLSPEEMEKMRNIGEVVKVVENKIQAVKN